MKGDGTEEQGESKTRKMAGKGQVILASSSNKAEHNLAAEQEAKGEKKEKGF